MIVEQLRSFYRYSASMNASRKPKRVDSLLSDRECELGKQLKINHDLIEVLDGWCFSISKRQFVENAISHSDVGRESPRAFVVYKRDKSPDVTFFKENLENSLRAAKIISENISFDFSITGPNSTRRS